MSAQTNKAKLPDWANILFEPHRYKVAYGGRGGSKSWSFAIALLILGAKSQHFILCVREIQRNIKYSVYKLLCDQIKNLGLSAFYRIMETEIIGVNGTIFSFIGLSGQTEDGLKSYEGTTICWAEEANRIVKSSWDVLIPTIRRADSEIWVSFNTGLDTDESYKRFVVNDVPDSVVVNVNYDDNPWFNEVLEKERLYCEITDPEAYKQIWLGHPRSAIEGAIYSAEMNNARKESRICNVPYDPMLKVHCVWDLGWNDSMFIIMAQRLRSEIRIIDVIEDDHKTLDWYISQVDKKNYNMGFDFLPHDAVNKDFKTGKSTHEMLKAFGHKTKPIPNIRIEEGIRQSRMMFSQCYFDRVKADPLVESLKRLRRKVNKATGEDEGVFHDGASHGGDAFRYLAIIAEQMTNATDKKPTPKIRQSRVTAGMGM